MIEFRTLGTLDLRGPQGEFGSVLSQRKRVALLAWLCLARPHGFHSRDSALALFWPDRDETHARKALNRALYWLRHSLGEGVLQSRGDQAIRVDTDMLWIDAVAFETATREGRYRDGAALYRGELLRGFFISDGLEFERWLDLERHRLQRMAYDTGRALIEIELAKDDLTAAAEWARWTLEQSPGDEPTVRKLISILDASGDRAGAARAYDQFARDLAGELELPPSPETQALVGSVRGRTHSLQAITKVASAEQQATDDVSPGDASSGTGTPPDTLVHASPDPPQWDRPRTRWMHVAAIGALVAASWWTAVRGQGGQDPERGRVVVYPFANRTGDSALDALGELAADRITRELFDAGIVATQAPATTDVGRGPSILGRLRGLRTAKNADGGIVIRGAIHRTNRHVHLQATVTKVGSRPVDWSLPVVSVPVDVPDAALQEIADRATGASAALRDPRFASWLPLANTAPTLDAFQEFARGDDFTRLRKHEEARHAFRRAATLDTAFTWARLEIAASYLNTLDTTGADSIADSLDRVRDRLTALQLAWLNWIVAVIGGNNEQAFLAAARAAAIAPDRFLALHAEVLRWMHHPHEVITLLSHAAEKGSGNRDHLSYWPRIADSYHELHDHQRELGIATRMRRERPNDMLSLWLEVRALAALGRAPLVLTRLTSAESLPPHAGLSLGGLLRQTGEELHAHGNRETARLVLDRTIAWFKGLPPEEMNSVANRFEVARALYLRDRLDESEAIFRQLAIDNPLELPEYEGALGVIAARRGDRVGAEAYLAQLEAHRVAADPPAKYPLFAQARIVAWLGDPERAVRLLREALGGQGLDLHMDMDFEPLATDSAFKAFIRPKG